MVLPFCSSANFELTEARAANRPAQTARRNPDMSSQFSTALSNYTNAQSIKLKLSPRLKLFITSIHCTCTCTYIYMYMYCTAE